MHEDIEIRTYHGVSEYFRNEIALRLPGVPRFAINYLADVLSVAPASPYIRLQPGTQETEEERFLHYRGVGETCMYVMVLSPRVAIRERREKGYIAAGQTGYREAAMLAALLGRGDAEMYSVFGDEFPRLVRGLAGIVGECPIIAILNTGISSVPIFSRD